jgi:hypothetical protein
VAGLDGFEGMNEPYNTPTDDVFAMHEQGIKACYDAGWRGKYYVSGRHPWQNGPTFWIENPNLHLVPNPGLRLIFSAHGYADRDSSGTHFGPDEWGLPRAEGPAGAVTDVDVLIDRYRPFIEGCEARGVEASVGECGIDMTGGPIAIECFQKTLAYLQAHKCSWFVWATGPIWPAAYAYSLENRANGLQSPGMVVFDDYYGNPAPTKFAFEGPSRLADGDTTADFTVTYYGRISSNAGVHAERQRRRGHVHAADHHAWGWGQRHRHDDLHPQRGAARADQLHPCWWLDGRHRGLRLHVRAGHAQ